MRLLTLSVALLLIHLWLPASQAQAHRPLFPSEGEGTSAEPYPIPDLGTSWAIYNRTGRDGKSVYEVKGSPGQSLAVELLVPAHDWKDAPWPQLSVLSPDGTRLAGPSSSAGTRERFYEPFTQTAYYRVHSEELTLPESGKYHVEVTSNTPRAKHVLAPGRRERWRPSDIARMPLIWFRVRYWVSPPAALAGVGVLLLPIALFARMRSRKT